MSRTSEVWFSFPNISFAVELHSASPPMPARRVYLNYLQCRFYTIASLPQRFELFDRCLESRNSHSEFAFNVLKLRIVLVIGKFDELYSTVFTVFKFKPCFDDRFGQWMRAVSPITFSLLHHLFTFNFLSRRLFHSALISSLFVVPYDFVLFSLF